MSSIVIDYLYRDAGNNKQYGQRVLSNPMGIPPEVFWGAFQKAFRDSQLFPDILHFSPATLGWAELFFPNYDINGADICLHELVGIELSGSEVSVEDSAHDLLMHLFRLSPHTRMCLD
jgi:hypothetical protein